MKKVSFWISTGLIFAFWPISFILANTQSWFVFAASASVLIIDWVLYLKKFEYHYFLYLILPIIHPTYLVFPLVAVLPNLNHQKKVPLVIYAVILIAISLFSYKTFYAYSIFTPDPLAKDTLIKKISLIPSRNLARVFENKTTVSQEKFKANTFLFLDPNNYFFSLHPREIGDNQNLVKYPYLAIIPFLLGLYYILENIHKRWLITIFIAAIVSLGFINNPDRYDLLLYLPISMLCFYGLKKLTDVSNVWCWIFSIVFIPVSLIELVRIIVFK